MSLAIGGAEEVVPPLQVDELKTAWGVTVERESYYLKDGEKVEHGLLELFSDSGMIEIRNRYAHGEVDGIQEYFYEGIGSKKEEYIYVAGVEQGLWRTWSPEGKILFERTWKDGKKWEGWFDFGSSGGDGVFHKRGAKWKVVQWKEGKKVAGSEKELGCHWRGRAEGTLADHKMFTRWPWPRFGRTNYPYLDEMPSYAKVPFLIEYVAKKDKSYQIANDQLIALTRMQFGNPWLQKDEKRSEAAEKWRTWWKDVGRNRPEQRAKRGVRDAKAWDLVRGGRKLPVPKSAVVIPSTYELVAHYSSGDYGGVISESITIRRNGDSAELVREFSMHRDGPVIKERWLPFGVEEADRVVRAIGYLRDRPWLINDEEEIEKHFWEDEKDDGKRNSSGSFAHGKIEGRESYSAPYYPGGGVELRDGAGKVWWNADVDSWYGGNPERFNQTPGEVPGTAFPFLARRYPESARREDGKERGWETK